jgi:hypothetical protein
MTPARSAGTLTVGGTVDQAPRLALSGVVLDSPDAGALADFYRSLLGWEIERDEPGWVKLRSHDGGPGLSFCLSLPGRGCGPVRSAA